MDSIKFNKLLNEKYFLLKDIAQKYNYKEELLDMITFIYLSFYMDFGKNCDFPLYDLFNKVKIIYDHGKKTRNTPVVLLQGLCRLAGKKLPDELGLIVQAPSGSLPPLF